MLIQKNLSEKRGTYSGIVMT